MNEEDLRDCFAMFAMLGIISSGRDLDIYQVWDIADKMVEARSKTEDEDGIVAIKKRRYVRKN